MKKIIALVLSLVLVLSCFPSSGFASEDISFIVNESFENYPTNGVPDSIIARTGLDTRVVELGDNNKAVYSKAQEQAVKISVPLKKTLSKMVFSFDIRIDGDPVKGVAMALTNGSASTKLFNFNADRSVRLEDGMHVSGYSQKVWKCYAVAIDFSKEYYDLYIDGKLISSKRKFYSALTKPSELSFNLSGVEGGSVSEIYLDNIRAYEGSEPLAEKSIPKAAYNNEVLDFNPEVIEEKVYDTIFIDSNSKQGIGALSLVPKDNVAEWASMTEGGAQYIHFKKNGSTDTYGDLRPTVYEGLDKYVYQTDIYPVQNSGGIIIARSNDSSGGYSEILGLRSGNLRVGDTDICKIDFGKWTTVAIACNLLAETGDVYVNGELVTAGVALPSGGIVPSYFRIGFLSGGSADDEVYFNKIKFYDGNTIRSFDDSEDVGVIDEDAQTRDSMKSTCNETDEQAIKMLGNDIVFMTSADKLFANGVKADYSAYGMNAYLSDAGKVMVDANVFNKLFGTYVESDDGFVDAAAEAKALNKYVYEDNRNFVLISDQSRGYVNHSMVGDGENQEDIDVIYRYMHYDRPSGDELYEDLVSGDSYRSHPRLFVTKSELPALKNRINSNPSLKKSLISLIDICDAYFDKEPQTYKLDGIRLFSACYEVKQRLMNLSTVYLLTGDEKYAERAWIELENCLNWPDFNQQQHFLDSGEVGPGLAIAYDSLYDYLTNEQKAFVRQRIEDMFIDYAVGIYTGSSPFSGVEYRLTECNWGAVCGASMLMVASTFIDEEDADSLLTAKCAYLASNAMQTFEHIHTGVGPDGVWNEGLGYTEYVLEHTGWELKTLANVYGDDYEFASAPGIETFGDFLLYMQTKNGGFNYSDTGPNNPNIFPPEVFVLADMCNDRDRGSVYYDFYNALGMNTYIARYLMFCNPENYADGNTDKVPLDISYSTSGMSIIKGSWSSMDSLYLGINGGMTTKYGSTHSDKGSFMFEALGERWGVDIGRYNSDHKYGETVMNRTENHSALVIDPGEDIGQDKKVGAYAIKSEFKPTEAMVVYDLAGQYGDKTNSYVRGFRVTDNRNSLIVQDELSLNGTRELQWNFITKASVKIDSDNRGATLSVNGKTLRVDVYCSAPDWKLEYTDLRPYSGWDDDTIKNFLNGTGKLRLTTKASGNVTISVKFTPEMRGVDFAPHTVTPIDSWVLSDAAMPAEAVLNGIYLNAAPIDGFVTSKTDYSIEIPYGSKIPYITATAVEGTVDIKQIDSITDTAVITLTMPDGRVAKFNINFTVSEVIVDNIIDTKPQIGIPEDIKKLTPKSIYASYEPQSENNAQNAIDGDLNTRWSADTKGSYMEIDLGEVYDLSGIALAYADGDERNYRYEILVSEDKMKYERVFVGESTGGTNDYEFLPLNVKARYVRYIGNQHRTGKWNSITEFRPSIAD